MTAEACKPLILIVDDTPVNVQVLAEHLSEDYRVKVANRGQLALDIIARQGAPDLILLDVMMPDMDGYEVCRRLKDDPKTQSIPVIFVTAMVGTSDEEKGLALGALDYIAKPYQVPLVKARIRNYIRLKQMTDMLEEMAWMDGLTNIANRRRFDCLLEAEWKRAQRSGTPLSVVMLDIDFFKDYNDYYGHSEGDRCLKRVADVLANTVTRTSDLVARYGGEEFVILLPGSDAQGAHHIAGQLCLAVESQQMPHRVSEVSPWVTVSVGYASRVPQAGECSIGLLEEADRMLYSSKGSGRNRVLGSLCATVLA